MAQKDLTDFIEQVTGESHLRVEDDLGDGFVVLRVSEAERRQARHDVRSSEDIIIEMLRNARDAHAKHIFVATAKEGSVRRIIMLDDGDGVPEHLQKRIFDARVTSKLDSMHIDTWGVHGRGMALYAVRLNTTKAYVAASKCGGGSSFFIESDTSVLPEKSDQSSQPVFITDDSGVVVVRGRRNINRTVAEFAYVNREQCSVYLGSPVEIAACLWEFGRLLLAPSTRDFCTNPDEVDVCKRIALASSPEEFVHIAAGLGLELSSRSARRIMDGQIASLNPVLDGVNLQQKGRNSSGRVKNVPQAHKAIELKENVALKLSEEDIVQLQDASLRAFSHIAESYYVEADAVPRISVRKGAIHISIPFHTQS